MGSGRPRTGLPRLPLRTLAVSGVRQDVGTVRGNHTHRASPSALQTPGRGRAGRAVVNGMSSRNLYNRNRPWVIERDQRLCRYCGCRTTGEYGQDALTIDHIVPRSRGGTHAEANLVVACRQCNHLKKDRLLEEAGMTLLPIGTLIEYPRNRKREAQA